MSELEEPNDAEEVLADAKPVQANGDAEDFLNANVGSLKPNANMEPRMLCDACSSSFQGKKESSWTSFSCLCLN